MDCSMSAAAASTSALMRESSKNKGLQIAAARAARNLLAAAAGLYALI